MSSFKFLNFVYVAMMTLFAYYLLGEIQQVTQVTEGLGQHQNEKIFEADIRSPMATLKIIEAFTR